MKLPDWILPTADDLRLIAYFTAGTMFGKYGLPVLDTFFR